MIKNKLKRHRYFWVRVINLLLVIGICFVYQNIATVRAEKEEKIMSQNRSASSYKDGTYQGTGTGFGGDIVVSVTIKNNSIDNIKILEAKNEDKAYLENAKSILKTMVKTQAADVDVASGATFSSKGIIQGTKNALKEAS
ncbi:MAG: FMN-binding protein [Anaerostipes sp.]|nr:FMN-binding protein [Anaerostipes sp.]MDD3747332.1 FMN-binding protein [Anaerostipes sp.]